MPRELAYYENNSFEHLDMGADTLIYPELLQLRSWSFEPIVKGKKIVGFDWNDEGKQLPMRIRCDTQDNAAMLIDSIHDITMSDVLLCKAGKLTINDYYLRCFITASEKTAHRHKTYADVDLTISTDMPFWIKENTTRFSIKTNDVDGLAYPHNYPHNYGVTGVGDIISNPSIVPAEFRFEIFGAAINPQIQVGGNSYLVNTSIEEGEKLVIDSLTKRVYRVLENGQEQNEFGNRNKASWIFAPMPIGEYTIAHGNTFSFNLTLYEQRAEPKWYRGEA